MESTDKPTKAQMVKFWKQHGLHHNEPNGGFFWDEGNNLVFDMHKGETGINLDILFKYAVSEHLKAKDDERMRPILIAWVNKLLKEPAYADYPALALFWVLQRSR